MVWGPRERHASPLRHVCQPVPLGQRGTLCPQAVCAGHSWDTGHMTGDGQRLVRTEWRVAGAKLGVDMSRKVVRARQDPNFRTSS